MKKIVILGCENSHADNFLRQIQTNTAYSDIEVLGVYSNEPEAQERICSNFGVPGLASYDAAVGQVDGVIITARHGDNHYKYAKPYIASGVPMFIDKPITVSESDAQQFMRELKEAGVRISGGSCLKYAQTIQELKQAHESAADGKTIGGCFRAPLSGNSPYGGFFFYAQHLVEMILTVFGKHPVSVAAFKKDVGITAVIRYAEFDICAVFTDTSHQYYATRFSEKGTQGGNTTTAGCFECEFHDFYQILHGGEQLESYEDFAAPVYVMNAIVRSLESGKEETVKECHI